MHDAHRAHCIYLCHSNGRGVIMAHAKLISSSYDFGSRAYGSHNAPTTSHKVLGIGI